MGFESKIFENTDELTSTIVREVVELVNQKPDAVICFACGETPRPVMTQLAKLAKAGEVDFSRVQIVGLDEWVGVGRETIGSCAQMLYDDFFSPVGFKEEQLHIFNGLAKDLNAETEKANQFIYQHGLDFVLLGVGMNGHIGLNEPGFDPSLDASVVELSETTQKVMMKYFNKEAGLTQGITLGFKQLLNAGQVIVMITGQRKAKIAKEILESEPDLLLPGSWIKNASSKAKFYLDTEAATLL